MALVATCPLWGFLSRLKAGSYLPQFLCQHLFEQQPDEQAMAGKMPALRRRLMDAYWQIDKLMDGKIVMQERGHLDIAFYDFFGIRLLRHSRHTYT